MDHNVSIRFFLRRRLSLACMDARSDESDAGCRTGKEKGPGVNEAVSDILSSLYIGLFHRHHHHEPTTTQANRRASG